MNLIDRLGGYDEAKKHLDSCWCDDDNKVYLLGELLKYRREHNIFEVVDWVVKAQRLKDDSLYRINEVAESKNYVKTKCGVSIDAPMVRHATDEEIKAGRRL